MSSRKDSFRLFKTPSRHRKETPTTMTTPAKKTASAKDKTLALSIPCKRLVPWAKLPARKTTGAAGFDLCLASDCTIPNTNVLPQAVVAHTGIALAIPEGFHGKILLRSSTGLSTKVRLANGTGIIDSDYRGEICLLLENNARQTIHLAQGERIAQLLIERSTPAAFEPIDELPTTARGAEGFGSTGKD